MKASKTELLSLFKQAFEGCGLDQGGFESAAEMLVFCEMSGLQAFASITGRMAEFSQAKRRAIEIVDDQINGITINAHAGSSVLWADLVSDLVAARASSGKPCAVTILNGHERRLIIWKMTHLIGLDYCGFAFWQSTDEPGRVLQISALPGSNGPELSSLEVELETDYVLPPQSQLLVYAKSEAVARAHIVDNYPFLSGAYTPRITAESLHENYLQALTGGIEISERLWSELGSQASRVLVESSDQSRTGAGV